MERMKKYIISCCLPVLLLVACNKAGNEKGKEEDLRGKVIIETGELAAVNSKAFVLPRYGRYWYEMRIIGILEHGSIVQAGDSIIQVDPTEIKKFIIDRESNLETEVANLNKLMVDHENKINEQESKVKNETASFNLKKVELESSRFESDRLRRIKELEFEQAKIGLAKEKRKLELLQIVNANDLRIQEIKTQQIENEINDAYNILPTLTIYTPISGVFQIAHSYRTGTLVKVGDNIYPGNNIANVPELKWMKVNTFINETDFLKIHTGQKVTIRLDAMPNVSFDGEIAYIGKLCHLRDQKSKQKVFDVEVNIIKPDERLKPGMTVSCEFLY
ncbi:efflux RND transporter periplasmic adaptor subunit [Parabacteroides sp. OttesenSCG-928-G06]|nr:efflux RND transporter periplasmic adaptor subunit [Parabacteroides sp. OttesenSCG-928-K15]MDL2282107.1 efflux RND transporter periplasmic adaptor subunit [Parabacteroides sp. OttesenSCG-928-G06]